ncbi:MAG: hypothetical protein IT223_12765 [Crocinitomicaceae bacterium]|nr:hypothetical protein [Crocinitomicaceae bacterium]
MTIFLALYQLMAEVSTEKMKAGREAIMMKYAKNRKFPPVEISTVAEYEVDIFLYHTRFLHSIICDLYRSIQAD